MWVHRITNIVHTEPTAEIERLLISEQRSLPATTPHQIGPNGVSGDLALGPSFRDSLRIQVPTAPVLTGRRPRPPRRASDTGDGCGADAGGGSNSYRGTVAVRAKICGVRSEADLWIAVDAGADALGFISGVTHFSEDALDADAAARLACLVPPFVTRVLVTHLEDAAAIVELADRVGTDAIQVHGLVTADTVRQVKKGARGRRVIKAVHVTGPDAVDAAREAASDCDAILLDSRTADRLGGTGRTHDWSISAAIVSALAELNCPVILAGGLTPANVTRAIEAVRPFAIDVNSGVETATGDKQPEACAAFVHAAHGAFNRIEPPAP